MKRIAGILLTTIFAIFIILMFMKHILIIDLFPIMLALIGIN